MFIPNITTIEVINVFLLLKNSCTCWDDIPAYVIKRCIHLYIEPLTHIIDKSMKEGVFPSELKLAKWFQYSNLVIRVKLPTTDLFLLYLSSQSYLNELCIIILLTLLTPLTFSINTNLDQHAIITLVNKITPSLDTGDLVISVYLDLKRPLILLTTKFYLTKCMHTASGETY